MVRSWAREVTSWARVPKRWLAPPHSETCLMYPYRMSDEKKTVADALRDWGIDVDRFEERAKESFATAKGDLTEITGTLRHTLIEAKDILVGMQKSGTPVAAELKGGFERAWQEIERAFAAARQRAKEAAAEKPAEEKPADADETE